MRVIILVIRASIICGFSCLRGMLDATEGVPRAESPELAEGIEPASPRGIDPNDPRVLEMVYKFAFFKLDKLIRKHPKVINIAKFVGITGDKEDLKNTILGSMISHLNSGVITFQEMQEIISIFESILEKDDKLQKLKAYLTLEDVPPEEPSPDSSTLQSIIDYGKPDQKFVDAFNKLQNEDPLATLLFCNGFDLSIDDEQKARLTNIFTLPHEISASTISDQRLLWSMFRGDTLDNLMGSAVTDFVAKLDEEEKSSIKTRGGESDDPGEAFAERLKNTLGRAMRKSMSLEEAEYELYRALESIILCKDKDHAELLELRNKLAAIKYVLRILPIATMRETDENREDLAIISKAKELMNDAQKEFQRKIDAMEKALPYRQEWSELKARLMIFFKVTSFTKFFTKHGFGMFVLCMLPGLNKVFFEVNRSEDPVKVANCRQQVMNVIFKSYCLGDEKVLSRYLENLHAERGDKYTKLDLDRDKAMLLKLGIDKQLQTNPDCGFLKRNFFRFMYILLNVIICPIPAVMIPLFGHETYWRYFCYYASFIPIFGLVVQKLIGFYSGTASMIMLKSNQDPKMGFYEANFRHRVENRIIDSKFDQFIAGHMDIPYMSLGDGTQEFIQQVYAGGSSFDIISPSVKLWTMILSELGCLFQFVTGVNTCWLTQRMYGIELAGFENEFHNKAETWGEFWFNFGRGLKQVLWTDGISRIFTKEFWIDAKQWFIDLFVPKEDQGMTEAAATESHGKTWGQWFRDMWTAFKKGVFGISTEGGEKPGSLASSRVSTGELPALEVVTPKRALSEGRGRAANPSIDFLDRSPGEAARGRVPAPRPVQRPVTTEPTRAKSVPPKGPRDQEVTTRREEWPASRRIVSPGADASGREPSVPRNVGKIAPLRVSVATEEVDTVQLPTGPGSSSRGRSAPPRGATPASPSDKTLEPQPEA